MAAIDSQSVTPISFQPSRAEDFDPQAAPHRTAIGIDEHLSRAREWPTPRQPASDRRKNQESNFSMRTPYPAVIFHGVCFRVSKSQQQANFLAECLGKAKQCLSLGLAGGSLDEQVDILKSINLNVPTGSIFGLLGPSSCGKTTLLRCLVNLLQPSSGSISLFCQETRSYGSADDKQAPCCNGQGEPANLSKVPGSNVGYMPQDLGLYEDFTIRQLLTMFGNYVGMESRLIKSRIAFMTKFLDLPNADREIMSLSGGQKRRVSFAIACIHMPPLIILDEPTVGVDPLLRQSIWKYLRQLADEENKTIIITTHYIEEAAQADQVALMRAGEILVQDSPRRIMQSNRCKTLEEAFLKICSNVEGKRPAEQRSPAQVKLKPQLKFNWQEKIKCEPTELMQPKGGNQVEDVGTEKQGKDLDPVRNPDLHVDGDEDEDPSSVADSIVRRLQERAQEKLAIFEYLQMKHSQAGALDEHGLKHLDSKSGSSSSNMISKLDNRLKLSSSPVNLEPFEFADQQCAAKKTSIRCLKRSKLVISPPSRSVNNCLDCDESSFGRKDNCGRTLGASSSLNESSKRGARLMWALLYKNYRRNINSLPLLAFQFMLPIIQMITFSLCIGGRPTNIGLGLVNHDQLLVSYGPELMGSGASLNSTSATALIEGLDEPSAINGSELLSLRYLSFLDTSMLAVRNFDHIGEALGEVRKGNLWAAMEIGANFTRSIASRFDLDNFYQLNLETIEQSVIKLYPDRSNKVLDMICQRSLVNSYREFLLDEFEHFKRLPIEVKEPIFDIKPNLISNSMDGYTESIAAGLLASLTYIMAAGLTTFIMVVERSAGILERTYTSGISPIAYLLAHAIFRSFVMMLQIGLVLFLTFYLLQQPLEGSIWLAYLMLMSLNLTGIAYGLLISSLVSDQNGAALTIVSSLVVKITMSGILWPFEAIPRWLRAICYVQPLTMPVQALKSITLKGAALDDRTVYLGFLVSLTWLLVFLTVAARRFKFYQH